MDKLVAFCMLDTVICPPVQGPFVGYSPIFSGYPRPLVRPHPNSSQTSHLTPPSLTPSSLPDGRKSLGRSGGRESGLEQEGWPGRAGPAMQVRQWLGEVERKGCQITIYRPKSFHLFEKAKPLVEVQFTTISLSSQNQVLWHNYSFAQSQSCFYSQLQTISCL